MVGEIPQQDTTILVGMEVIHQNILAGGHQDHHQEVVVEAAEAEVEAEVEAGVVDSAVAVAVEDNI
jgi:hypothetical protein